MPYLLLLIIAFSSFPCSLDWLKKFLHKLCYISTACRLLHEVALIRTTILVENRRNRNPNEFLLHTHTISICHNNSLCICYCYRFRICLQTIHVFRLGLATTTKHFICKFAQKLFSFPIGVLSMKIIFSAKYLQLDLLRGAARDTERMREREWRINAMFGTCVTDPTADSDTATDTDTDTFVQLQLLSHFKNTS